MNMPTKAVILAAGRGKRLRPYTDSTPKPLLPVNGRPTLAYILDAVGKTNVTDVCLVTSYLAHQIEAYVGDGTPWRIQVQYRRRPPQGTADALKATMDFLTQSTFVIAADYVLPLNYLQVLQKAYFQAGTPLAVSLKRLPVHELSKRSSVRWNPENRQVFEIIEKPALGIAPSSIGASLLYIVPPDIRGYLQHITLSERGEYELPSVINRMLQDGYEMTGCLQEAPPEFKIIK